MITTWMLRGRDCERGIAGSWDWNFTGMSCWYLVNRLFHPYISRLDASQLVGETTQLTKDPYDQFQQDILVEST